MGGCATRRREKKKQEARIKCSQSVSRKLVVCLRLGLTDKLLILGVAPAFLGLVAGEEVEESGRVSVHHQELVQGRVAQGYRPSQLSLWLRSRVM